MNTKKVIRYGIFAAIISIAVWLGGYTWFLKSEEWEQISTLIRESETIKNKVGEVSDISTNPFRFSFRFSGGWAETEMVLRIEGDKDESKFRVEAERINWKWKIKRISD